MARRSFPGPAPRTNLFPNPAAEKPRLQAERPASKRKNSPSQNNRTARRSRLIEQLEERKVFAAPTLGDIPAIMAMYAGAPIHIGIDGIDADGDALDYTVTSNNSSVTAEYRAGTNRSLVLNITHTSSGPGDPAFSGRLVFELFDDLTPITASKIADITNAGDYDGVIFHRIINDFVIQGGDPNGTGMTGSGPRYDDEFNAQLMHTVSGLLSMANSGNDTNSSQFFVTEGTSAALRNLDFNHSIFGMMTEDVITSGAGVGGSLRDAISNLHNPANEANDFVDGDGKPAGAVTITSAKIIHDNQNRVLTIKAPDGYTGSATIEIKADDGNGGTVTKTVTVNVTPDTLGDARPFFVDLPKSVSIPTNGSYSVTLQTVDADGGAAAFFDAFSYDQSKVALTINSSTGQMTLTPVNGFTGVVNIIVGVTNNGQNGFGSEASYDGQVIQVYVGSNAPTTPLAVNLLSGSDTGASAVDDVTNKNMSAATGAAGQLTFQVTGVTPGMTVRLMSYGQIIGEAVASGTTVNITTSRLDLVVTPNGGQFDLGPNGVANQAIRKITAVQVLKNQTLYNFNSQTQTSTTSTVEVVSQPTPELAITVDDIAPTFSTTPSPTRFNEGTQWLYDPTTSEEGNTGHVYTLVNAPVGMDINPVTGVVTWTPTELQAQTGASFKIRATDLAGNVVEQDIVLTINRKPDFTSSPTEKINEGAQFQYNAETNEEVNGGLVYSLETAPTGMTIDPSTGQVSWNPSPAQIAAGSASVTIRVVDTEGAFETQSFTVLINRAPALEAITNKTVDEFVQLTVPGTGSDIDNGDTLVYSLINPPAGVLINPSTGQITFTPGELDGGSTITINVRVTDSGNLFADTSFDVTIVETNSLPVITPVPIQRLESGDSLDVEIIATDSDIPSQSPLVYELVNIPPGLTNQPLITQSPNSNPRVVWTPTPADGIGPFLFTIRVSDGVGFSDVVVTVTQNVPPVIDPIADQSVNENTTFTHTAHATDANDDPLVYSFFGVVPTGMTINPTTGIISWTPGEAEGGNSYVITVRATDPNNRFDESTFNLTVNDTNEKAVVTNPGPKEVNLGDTLTIGIIATDSDLPQNALTYFLIVPPNLTSTPSINSSTGEITWTPVEADGIGPFEFEVYVNDGTEDSVSVKFMVEVNHPPVFTLIGPQDTSEGTQFTLQLSATDANNDSLTFTPLSALPSGLTLSASGEIKWTPGETAGGQSFSFLVRVTDGTFAADQTITINVAETNSAPVAGNNPLVTINEGATAEFTVNATDSDDPAQILTYELVSGPEGATIDPSTGKVTWTSTENDGGTTKSFVVRVTDDGDGNLFTDFNVQVKVNEVNTLPVLTVDNQHTVNEGTQLSFTATATDADAPTQALTYSLVNAPAGMTINPTTGVVTWSPTEAQGPGTFEFQVKVTDSEGGSATANVSVTVNEVNSSPVLAPITNRTVLQGGTISIANSATDADIPSQTLTYSLDQAPAGVTIDATTGQISWNVPANQAVGVQEVIVRVTDSFGAFSTQSFLLEVLDFSIGNFLAIFPQGTITNVPPVDFRQFSFGQQFIVTSNFNFNPLQTQVQPNVVDNGIINSGMGRLQGVNEEIRIEDGKQRVYKPTLPDAGGSETSTQAPAPNANANASEPSSPTVGASQNVEVKKADAAPKVSAQKMRVLHAEALAEFTRGDLVLANLENGSPAKAAPTALSIHAPDSVTSETRQAVSEESSKSSALPAIAMIGAAVAAKSIAPRGKSAGLTPQAIPVPSADLSQKRNSRWSWFGK